MIPTQSALRAYDASYVIEHAAHWRDLAARRRAVVGAIKAQADALDWQGQGDEAMRAAMQRHLSTAEEEAGLLDAAADTAENGASALHQQQQSMLSGVDQARQQGFVVGEDWSASDAMYAPGSMGWYARQPTAQAISAELRTQAGAFAVQESQTATDMVTAAGDLGGEGTIRRHIQAVDNHFFKTDGPTPPQPPPSPPQTGEPIKLPPRTTMNTAPPQAMNPPLPERGFPNCSTEEVLKRWAEVLGGGLMAGGALPGELTPVTALPATAGVAGGGWMIWDGIDGLEACK